MYKFNNQAVLKTQHMWGKRDSFVLLMYALYLGMVVVGSYFYSWTPLCFLYPLFGPKSKAGMFVNKKFLEWRKTFLDSVTDTDSSQTWTPKFVLLYLSYNLNVPMCAYIGFCHALALNGLYALLFAGGVDNVFGNWVAPWSSLEQPALPIKTQTLYLALALWPLTGFGITAGAHRLWAHRTYKAHWSVRTLLMLLNSMAHQGSIYHWCRDHRTHHRHSDAAADPHNSGRGFFFAHVGWLLVKKSQACVDAGRKIDISDLKADPIVMFQKRLDPWWNFVWCFAVPSFFAMIMWNETLWNAFLVAGVMRYVFVLHCTWCVNSVAHFFGNSTYDPTQPPAESAITAFLAVGEGWHSWHHAFAFDYATSELGCLQQYNPTKFIIDCWAKLGLVVDRKRGLRMWNERKEKLKALYNCDIVESLTGPPLFRSRRITLVPKDGAKETTLDALVESNVQPQEDNILEAIRAAIPREKIRNMTPIAVLRNAAYVYSVCTLPWPIIGSVVLLDVIVPKGWVSAGLRPESDCK